MISIKTILEVVVSNIPVSCYTVLKVAIRLNDSRLLNKDNRNENLLPMLYTSGNNKLNHCIS